MGQRQIELDKNEPFKHGMVYALPDDPDGKYGKGDSNEVLPTESFYDPATRKQVFQPHHDVITDESQVQIYEELMAGTNRKITTSFVGVDHLVKNDRLLPKGWRRDGPLADFTGPHGDAERDHEYINKSGSSGSDTIGYRVPLNERTRGAVAVMAVLYYQSIPPYYLKKRFHNRKGSRNQKACLFDESSDG